MEKRGHPFFLWQNVEKRGHPFLLVFIRAKLNQSEGEVESGPRAGAVFKPCRWIETIREQIVLRADGRMQKQVLQEVID